MLITRIADDNLHMRKDVKIMMTYTHQAASQDMLRHFRLGFPWSWQNPAIHCISADERPGYGIRVYTVPHAVAAMPTLSASSASREIVCEQDGQEEGCRLLLWKETFTSELYGTRIMYSVQVNDRHGYTAVLRHIASNEAIARRLFLQLAESVDRAGIAADAFAELRAALVEDICFS